jgi:ABC-type branched-subunit amino acid transport system substrate-binding protein
MNNWSFYEGSICGRYFFHMAAVPNQQIDRMIPWMAQKYGKRFYFVGNDYEWPHGSIAACKAAVGRIGGEILGEEYNPFGTTDFSSMLMRIRRAKPDVVVPYEAGSDQPIFLKQFTAMGLKKDMAVVMGHYDEAMMPGLEPEVRKDFYSCNTYFMTVKTEENKKFLSRLRKKYGENAILTNFGEGVIPCIRIWAKAVEKAGTTNVEEVIKAQEGPAGEVYGLSADCPSGKVTVVREHHHCKVTCHLAQCQADGTFKVLETWPDQDPVIPERYGGCVASVQYGCRPLKGEKCK